MSRRARISPIASAPFVDFPIDMPRADIPVAAASVPDVAVEARDSIETPRPPSRSVSRRSTTTTPQTRRVSSSTGAADVLMAILAGASYAWVGFQVILALTVGVARVSADGPAFAIESGSMQPALPIGSVVVTKAVDFSNVSESEIVSFEDPTRPGRVITHRVVDTSGGALTTRGDANAQPDSTPVPPSSILGRAFVVIPGAAKPVVWIQHGSVVPLALWLLSCLVATGFIQSERRMSRRAPKTTGPLSAPEPATERVTNQAAWT